MKYIYGKGPIVEALKNKSIDKLYISNMRLGEIIKLANEEKVLVSKADKKKLDEMTNNANHQGVVGLSSGFKYSDFDELIEKFREKKDAKILILDKINDPHNFGAIARSAVFMGFDAIIIPKHRQSYVNDTVYKSSAGAVEKIDIAIVTNLSQAVEKLKKEDFWIYATAMEGEEVKNVDFAEKLAIIIGNEGDGVSKNLLKNSDVTITIANHSDFDSLNASVAAAIVMYEIVR